MASSPVAIEENISPKTKNLDCRDNYREFKLTVNPDDESATEDSWALTNSITNEVIEVGTINSGGQQVYKKCLPICGHFKFTMLDKAGDGFASLSASTSTAGYSIHIDDEEMYQTPMGMMAFEAVSTEFHIVDPMCPEPSARLVHVTKDGKMMCLQPDGVEDDAQIVFKRCVDRRLKQRWMTDLHGRMMSAFHTNSPKCITMDAVGVDKSILHLRDCPVGLDMQSSFIINQYSGMIHLMFGDKMKALRCNERDNSLRVRSFDPEHRNLEAFKFHVENIFDGPGDEFPMISHSH